jgi:hypothetical protein
LDQLDKRSVLKSGLISILAGVSATAAFAATGFIAAFGREQFLGINLNDWSTQTLTLLAGRCVADSFFMVLFWALSHWVVLSVCVVLMGAGVVLLRHRKVPSWAPPVAESLVALVLLIWLLAIIVRFEGPTILLRGWVIAPDFETPLNRAICELSPTKECKKLSSKAAAAGVTGLGNYFDTKSSDSPGVLLLESSSVEASNLLGSKGFRKHQPEQAQKLLYNKYAAAVTLSALALLYVAISGKYPEAGRWSDILFVLRAGVIVASIISAVMLPYVYGKIVDPALFPNAFLQYTESRPSGVTENGDKVTGGDPVVDAGGFPVVSQTDTSIFILWVQGASGSGSLAGHTKIIEVPRDKIIAINYSANIDAIAKISECQMGEQGADCQ